MVVRRWVSHIFRTNLTNLAQTAVTSTWSDGRSLPLERLLVLISVRSWVKPSVIAGAEGLGNLKNPVTSSEFEPASLELAAQSLINYATECPVPGSSVVYIQYDCSYRELKTAGLLALRISPSQSLYLDTGKRKHGIKPQRYEILEWDSNSRPYCRCVWKQFMS
jgi:hypothetical protein